MPRSSCSSLWMLTSDGGIATPGRTEKHRPWAWRGPWYGSWPRISTRVVGVRREVQGGEHLVVRRVDGRGARARRARTPAARCQYGLANSPRSTGFQSVVIGRHLARGRRCGRRRSGAVPAYASPVAVTRPRAALDHVPRSRLATLPTPLERGPGLPGGARLWVKRDDLTGLGAGGNKARKLEFLCGEALRAGARSLVTVGAGQSNHCRMTAAAGAVLGLEVHLVLSGDRPARPTGNQLLAELFGAQLHYVGCPPNHWGELEIAREQLTDELAAAGAAPHSIPIGGSTPTGALGYLVAYVELVEQCRRRRHARRRPSCTRRRAAARTPGWSPGGRCCGRSATTTCPTVLAIGVAKGVDARRARRPRSWPREALALIGSDAAGRRRRRRDRRPLARRRLRRADAGRRDEAIRWAAVHGGWVLDRDVHRQGLRRPARQRGDRPLASRRRGRVHPHRRPAGRLRRPWRADRPDRAVPTAPLA